MSGRKEIIETYSHIISSRYKRLGWIAGLVCALSIFLLAWFDSLPGYSYILSGMTGLGLGFLWYLLNHRYKLLSHFNIRHADAFDRLEKYLLDKRERWDQTYMIRLALMLLLSLAMLLMLFFFQESRWTGITVVAFISLILAFMIKGWLDFNDEILLHDIRRNWRDQTSE